MDLGKWHSVKVAEAWVPVTHLNVHEGRACLYTKVGEVVPLIQVDHGALLYC